MFTVLKQWWHKFVLRFRTIEIEAAIPKPPPPPPRPMPPPPQPEPPRPQAQAAEPEPEQPGEPPSKQRKKYDSSYIHLRRDLAQTAEYMLDRFEKLHKLPGNEYFDSHRLLDDLWGCDFLLFDKELGERMKGGDKWSVVDDVGTTELAEAVWPIDYAVAYETSITDESEISEGVQLYRMHTVTAKDIRGKVTRVAPKMIRYLMGDFYDNGYWCVCEGYAGLINDRWILLHNGSDDYPLQIKRERHNFVFKVMHSIFAARYEWHVAFGTIPGGPRILLPTNPTAALHLFKNREKAPGKTRRDILKHWVEEHWRDTLADLQFVCNHLRGHTIFNWSGFGCELFVSAYDLEKNEIFKKEAKAWRAQRKHNRVRVHLKKTTPDNRATMH